MNQQTDQFKRLSAILFGVALFIVVIIAGWVRGYNLDWDQGTHLHPDERYLTMVVSALRFPHELETDTPTGFFKQLALYWDTSASPLNPTNYDQFAGYVYGTLPLFATRAMGIWIDGACGETPTLTGPVLRWLLLGTTAPCQPGLYTGYGGIHLVGRALSTLTDLATLIALVLLARALYGDLVALLAGALYAFAALPIQHAHFFVVDSFAAVFVIWTLYFLVLAVQERRPFWLLPAGVMTGLAVASKISVWPLAALVALASLVQRAPKGAATESRYDLALTPQGLLALALAGLVSALTFRSAQPYAFSGPGFFDILPNPQWMHTMRDIRELVSGLRDVPFGHQWANRAPILFPARNMIFWGLGLPLGIAAWVGWGALGWQIWRKRNWQHLLPWIWGTGFFLYQGTQWVKSMRYLLPIYPVFTLFAAWILVRGARWQPRRTAWRPLRYITQGLLLLVVLGTLLWGLAFLSIYAQPVTRIEATRWMYEHLPTAATLQTETGASVHIPLKPNAILYPGESPLTTVVTLDERREFVYLSLNKVNALGVPGPRQFYVEIVGHSPQNMPASTTFSVDLPADATAMTLQIPLSARLPIEPEVQVYLSVGLLAGNPVQLHSSVIANEHWDDSLPLRLDGKDAFWNWYQSLSSSHSALMNLYDNDTPQKREELFNWLDEADYIALSSNRLYGSIPRLPLRYPLSVAYYRALFDGSLGFELLAEFVSFPALGPCQFPDQEVPFAHPPPHYTNARPCSIPFPPAEEAFSVYDHPTVLIFAKTPLYSRANAEALLPESLLADVRWMTPLEATRQKDSSAPTLLMDTRTRLVQEAGGTWAKLFPRQALQNRFPVLAVFLWWAFLVGLGWMAFPLLYFAFPDFRYRGYGLAKAAGLLLWAYPPWLLASLRVAPHTRLTLWLCLLIGVGLAAWTLRTHWSKFRVFLFLNWRELLRYELLFGALFLLWVGVRYLNPDLWHPVVGGEKPMDFAYLNAVIKSTWFPPYDPWFSGGVMNYYYFGFVLIGSLTEALGILPSVAYNLAIPTLFALTGVGAFVLASNLAGGSAKRGLRAGMLGLLLVVLLGNLGEFRLIFKGLQTIGEVNFESLIPGYPATVSALVGLWKVLVEGKALLFRPEWWYWDATRVIPFAPGEVGAINEFPAFTFLYADLHAHAMALPLTQLALAVALQWGLGGGAWREASATQPRWRRWLRAGLPQPLTTFLLGALAVGALRVTNTWDYPTLLGLMSLSLLINLFRAAPATPPEQPEEGTSRAPRLLPFPYLKLLTPVLLFVAAELFFLPFTREYATAYTSFGLWKGTRTPLGIYLVMHGQFLFPLCALAVIQVWRMLARIKTTGDVGLWWILGLIAASMGLLLTALLLLGVPVAWLVIPLGFLAALFVLDPHYPLRARVLWLWVGTALTLSLAVEIFVLSGDIGRMNTVFKFYLQVWMLLAVSAAVAIERILDYAFTDVAPAIFREARAAWQPALYALADGVVGVTIILLFTTALYPALAIPARIRDRWRPEAPPSLNGMVFMPYAVQYEHGSEILLEQDYRVIHWLQDNVAGSPTILEAQAEREYLWGGRISIYTGLPSIAAWRWHQVQQRMVMPGGTVEQRQNDIRDFYNTSSPEQALDIVEKYNVGYIILTSYERAYMLPEGETKFPTLVARGWLDLVYDEGGAQVYRVVGR